MVYSHSRGGSTLLEIGLSNCSCLEHE